MPTFFVISSKVRGYHVYHHIWDALIREELPCEREADNYADSSAVAVVQRRNVVGHVLRRISTICSLFCEEEAQLPVL